MENTIKIINAIGQQWPFLIVIFIIIIIILKWKTIWNSMGRFNQVKFKKGDTAVEFSTTEEKTEEKSIPFPKTQQKLETEEPSDKTEDKDKTLFDVYVKLREGKDSEAEKTFKEIQDKSEPGQKIENEFVYLFYKFANGESGAEKEISKILESNNLSNEQKSFGFNYLGFCFKYVNNKEKAINAFYQAIELSSNNSLKTDYTISICDILGENDDIDSAISLLTETIVTTENENCKSKLYKSLAKWYESKGDTFYRAISLEKALDLSSNNTSILFDIAYCYSELDLYSPSIYHYDKLLQLKPNHPTALNNIGVGYSNKNLPNQSINYYKQAVENKNSVAAGNLAFIYMENGFSAEVEQLIEKFKGEKNIDERLIKAHRELVSSHESEKKEIKVIKKEGLKISSFYKKFADFFYEKKRDSNIDESNWTDDDNHKIELKLNKEELLIQWKVKNEKLNEDDIYRIIGKAENYAGEIVFEIPETIEPKTSIFSTLLGEDKKEEPYRKINQHSGYCILDLEKNKVQILYKKDKNYTFHNIYKPST